MRRILASAAAILVAVIGLVALAGSPASAAATSPAHCYGWSPERLAAQWRGPDGLWHTQQSMVMLGGPCRDVNVRSVTADGRPACRTMRVVWDTDTSIATGPWTAVCTRWRVLWSNAQEGRVFTIEIQGPPAMIGVRT
jgi:hypothetical protein